MNEPFDIKKQLCKKVEEILDNKISLLNSELASAKESRDSDTKSSVGDKYETSRAMMHIEIGKNEAQLNNMLRLKNELSKIDVNKRSDKVGFGSVVITNKGKYFISVAIGKVLVQAGEFYSVSLISPIGKILQGMKKDEVGVFNNQKIKIKDII
ncbi:hypothetical protein [Saccharicrinis sp. GN24d3]|uniref:hypothetical protein n=1 Tax=Saccharicrinis sp. GN24d3 TaxID=3458416 RepID=UPI0040364219